MGHSLAHLLLEDHWPDFPPVLTSTPRRPNRALDPELFFIGNNWLTTNTDYYKHKKRSIAQKHSVRTDKSFFITNYNDSEEMGMFFSGPGG